MANEPAPRVPLSALFLAFLTVSLCGFGGGIVWARRIAVERRRWISEEDFADILALCQFLPGPNIIGIAVCVGARLRDLAGATAAVAGFVLIPCAVGFGLGLLILQHAHLAVLHGVLGGVAAAAAGLLIATGIRMLLGHRRHRLTVIVAAATFAAMGFAHLPLLPVLFGATLISAIATMIESRVRS